MLCVPGLAGCTDCVLGHTLGGLDHNRAVGARAEPEVGVASGDDVDDEDDDDVDLDDEDDVKDEDVDDEVPDVVEEAGVNVSLSDVGFGHLELYGST